MSTIGGGFPVIGRLPQLFGPLHYLLGDNCYRFDYRLEKGRRSDKLDDASKKNINRLTRGALAMDEEMRPQLRELALARHNLIIAVS